MFIPQHNANTLHVILSRRTTREKWTGLGFWSCAVACLTAVVVRQIDETLSVHFAWLKSLFHFERIKTLTRDLILVLINFIAFLPSSNHVTLLLSHLPWRASKDGVSWIRSISHYITVKFRKKGPRAYIFQRFFLRGLFLEGLMYGGKFAFQNRLHLG